jgi:hypothetical protein
MKAPSHATAKAHAELLQQILRTSEKANTRPPAGVNAEYAFYLAKLGRVTEAKTYLAKEARHYPEATTFLKAFERFLAGITPFAKEAKQ